MVVARASGKRRECDHGDGDRSVGNHGVLHFGGDCPLGPSRAVAPLSEQGSVERPHEDHCVGATVSGRPAGIQSVARIASCAVWVVPTI